MGFENPSRTISIVKGWHYGRHPVVQSATAREQLTALTPSLLQAFVESKQAATYQQSRQNQQTATSLGNKA